MSCPRGVALRAVILLIVALSGGRSVAQGVPDADPVESPYTPVRPARSLVSDVTDAAYMADAVPSPPPAPTPSGPNPGLFTRVPTPAEPFIVPPEGSPYQSRGWDDGVGAWGLVGLSVIPQGNRVAPNGAEFNPILQLEVHTNVWVSPYQGVYLYNDMVFWGQRAAPGITNPDQGGLDFSKREYDLDVGVAWNYAGRWEARAYAYSFNNLNRGESRLEPKGYKDGTAIENRYYLGDTYDVLGSSEFDVARATFVSVGYHVFRAEMVDSTGEMFIPGLFARAYLTQDLYGERAYAYLDVGAIGEKVISRVKLLKYDFGVAIRPFAETTRWEFRLGRSAIYDISAENDHSMVYVSARFIW